MRIALGEFWHESNSFSTGVTELTHFAEHGLWRGTAVLQRYAGSGSVLGGCIDAARAAGIEIVPTIAASAAASGPVSARAYRAIRDDLVSAVRGAGALDGIILSLHGAMVTPAAADAEADLLAAVRAAAPGVQVVAVLDLHANVTPEMVAAANLLLSYNEDPHTDVYERGVEAVHLLRRIVQGAIEPVSVLVQPPLILPGPIVAGAHGPMGALHRLRARLERTPGVVNVSLFSGSHCSDQRAAGPSVLVTADGDGQLAQRVADILARSVWERRYDFLLSMATPEEAVRQALSLPGPVALIDECDDPAAGGSGDGTVLLRAMLDGGVRRGGVAAILDPEIVSAAFRAGLNGEVGGLLGAKRDRLHGCPVPFQGCITHLHRRPLPMHPWSHQFSDVGPLAVIAIGGIAVIVTSRRVESDDVNFFALLGIDITEFDVVALKGMGFNLRRAYGGAIEHFIPVAGAGATNPEVRALPYRRLRRPVFPLDDPVEWGA